MSSVFQLDDCYWRKSWDISMRKAAMVRAGTVGRLSQFFDALGGC